MALSGEIVVHRYPSCLGRTVLTLEVVRISLIPNGMKSKKKKRRKKKALVQHPCLLLSV